MKKIFGLFVMAVLLAACGNNGGRNPKTEGGSNEAITVKYAKGFSVRDTADMRLVNVGKKDRFALVRNADAVVPEGYVKVLVPIKSTICMTSLQLSNFTILDAHDVVKGITGTKNLFNEDIKARVKDGRIVKIGMEGEFDNELVIAANPDVIFISPSKRGGYETIKETGITLVPHLGYKELDPLGQAEWIKFIGMFIGKEKEANEIFSGIESRYNDLKAKAAKATPRPTITSGEMHYGNWHAVGGKNYLAQIFRDAGADYVINDDETSGEDLEFEKMYALSANADYWRILNSYHGDFSYEALKAEEPRNEMFKAFKEKKVIYCNMKQTPYYEIAPVQPDLLLKDFIAILHPELVEKDYTPTFYHLLK
ncbi:MAG: ABC transporter substrate-binding protein [Muribaculaceae bacterium]|nr:ABC transporter substrate-binding protein [Muribaculaceae bacterium]